ncbi:MAG: T9SS type A sorting domain-containing protein [Ignavibacteriales bacterium]|nr:T9SS type A sorting domain-containing protein [Ignavibacteriales bacterium]
MKKLFLVLITLLLVVGFSNAQYTKLWEKSAGAYPWLANDNSFRALAVNPVTGHLLVASKTTPYAIHILNALSGEELGTLDMTGVSGGTFNLNLVRVTADGKIYACNLALAAGELKLYQWANEAAVPTVAWSGAVAQRAGDAFQVTGSGVTTKIYCSGSSSNVIYVFSTVDGTVFAPATDISLSAAGLARGGISPIADNQEGGFWVNGAGTPTIHIDGTGANVDTINTGVIASGWHSVKYFERAGRKYVAVIGRNDATFGLTMLVYDITTSEKYPKHFLTLSLTNVYNANANATADVTVKVNPTDDSFIIYQLVSNNGIAAFKVNALDIIQAREDLNADNIPDRKTDTVYVKGVVFTPNYQTSNRSYYIWDGTAGIATFKSGLLSPALSLGDSVGITGFIDHYNGLTEITPLTDTDVVVYKDSAALPIEQELTLAQFKATPEDYEAEFVLFKNLTKVSGNWPTSGSANLTCVTGTDTIIVRIDSDTDIDGNLEPSWPSDIRGVITQFSSTNPAAGYQLQPRFFTDFLAIVPVELASFASVVKGNVVSLNWQTASELNNRGFEVYRNSEMVKFIPGFGTTNEKKSYQFADNNLSNGTYTYKLVQVDYSGAKKTVGTTEAVVNSVPTEFALLQNYPNPFNPNTLIKFALPSDSKVSLKVFSIIGEEVASLVNGNFAAGIHEVNFNAVNFNSGIYFYSISVKGVDGTNFTGTKKMILVK